MKAVTAVTLTASIENEEAIRDWTTQVIAAANEIQEAVEALSAKLREAPHISIRLDQT